MANENVHVFCPKCGSEVELADSNGKAIMPRVGDFFLRLKDNDPEKTKKLKDMLNVMFGDSAEFASVKETAPASKANNNEDEEDNIEQSIIEDGDINSKFLWRRWVMSQVLRHYKDSYGNDNFHQHFVKNTPLKYSFKVAANELEALSKDMSLADRNEREQFFTIDVARQMVEDYAKALDKKINQELKALEKYNRKLVAKKGTDTKLKDDIHIGRRHFTKDKAKYFQTVAKSYVANTDKITDYKKMANLLREFSKVMPMFNDCPKSKAWINAFKGAGAFYTLDNLIRWHKCSITSENGETYTGDEALAWLRRRTKELSGEYYKLYAIMKRTVEENNFDFDKRMKELRNEVA